MMNINTKVEMLDWINNYIENYVDKKKEHFLSGGVVLTDPDASKIHDCEIHREVTSWNSRTPPDLAGWIHLRSYYQDAIEIELPKTIVEKIRELGAYHYLETRINGYLAGDSVLATGFIGHWYYKKEG